MIIKELWILEYTRRLRFFLVTLEIFRSSNIRSSLSSIYYARACSHVEVQQSFRGTKHFSFRNVNCTAPLPGNKRKRNRRPHLAFASPPPSYLVRTGGELLRLKRVKDGTGVWERDE
jgi:hypothetical protein